MSKLVSRREATLGTLFGVVLSIVLFLPSPSASAHYAWPFYPATWDHSSSLRAGNLQSWLDGTAAHRAKTESDIVFARGQWNTVPNADWNFSNFIGFNNNIVYTTPCTTGGNLQTVIVTSSQVGGAADAPICGGQNGNAFTRGVVRLADASYWKKGGGNVNSNQIDLRSVIIDRKSVV